MKLYLDTEFNGHGGSLISMALAAQLGRHWYGVIQASVNEPKERHHHPWVTEHVLPALGAMKPTIIGCRDTVRASLREYLLSRQGSVIYADWPADFGHLMDMFSGPTYDTAFVPNVGMELLRETHPEPQFPHNALSDAIALMEWHRVDALRK